MRGSIYQRTGSKSWYACADRGSDPETGKRRKSTKGGFKTKKEAERWLRDTLTSLEQGTFVEPSKLTVGQFLTEEWLPSLATRGLRPTTMASYRMLTEKYLIPRVGAVPLQRLTASDLNKCYADLLKEGRTSGKGGGLKARSVRYCHMLMRKSLADAERWGRVPRNVAVVADPPRASAARADAEQVRAMWGPAEVAAFLNHIQDDHLCALFRLAVMTGMRRGELLGLRWQDVDLDQERISISQTVVTVGQEVQISTPKTRSGRRVVALDAVTVEALRAHRLRQLEERLAFGLGRSPEDGLVFCREDGSPLSPNGVTLTFKRLVKSSGVRRIRFHDLRHTWASLALAVGVHVKVVQEQLGHSTSAITLDVYSHAIPAMRDDAVERVAERVLAASQPTAGAS
ncbi:MAG TPA: site-specific integrase [Gaiellaceae bacterium]|nr:site-specific integrase [Gaiellaceae bacterium]